MRLALFLGLLALVNTCYEEKEEPEIVTCYFEVPCVNDQIEALMEEPSGETRASVTLINTRTTYYYYLSGLCCDKPPVLLDRECNIVCTYGAATLCAPIEEEVGRRVVWEDARYR